MSKITFIGAGINHQTFFTEFCHGNQDLYPLIQEVLDPLTAAVCTLPQIHVLVDEMFEAQAQWLPQF